jgi:DtxR family Mn-dependent transcriptional regulator
MENYLGVIYNIVSDKQAARSKDIAESLRVTAASVTSALRLLSDKGLINYAPYDIITLTRKGRQLAKEVAARHDALKNFFVKVLAVDESEAEEVAHKLEHPIPRKIMDRLIRFEEFAEKCPRAGDNWVKGFKHFCDKGGFAENCEHCITTCLDTFREKKRS